MKIWDFLISCLQLSGSQEFEDIREAGEKITKKLRGCPLVTKVIAGHLREHMTVQFWDRFLHEHIWGILMEVWKTL